MTFQAPVQDYDFVLKHIVDFDQIQATDRFADASDDVAVAILTEAGKLCDDVIAPLQRIGDLEPARLENGIVRTSTGYADGYAAIAEGGWIGINAGAEHGGMELPMLLTQSSTVPSTRTAWSSPSEVSPSMRLSST